MEKRTNGALVNPHLVSFQIMHTHKMFHGVLWASPSNIAKSHSILTQRGLCDTRVSILRCPRRAFLIQCIVQPHQAAPCPLENIVGPLKSQGHEIATATHSSKRLKHLMLRVFAVFTIWPTTINMRIYFCHPRQLLWQKSSLWLMIDGILKQNKLWKVISCNLDQA